MKNVLLYLSAFIPMYILIILKQSIEMLVGNIKANWLNFLVLGLLVVVIILGLIGLNLEIRHRKEQTSKIRIIEKQNSTDQHFLGYFSLFVLFAISFDLSKISMLVIFIAIMVMIGVVYVKNKLFYINPFLNILGYNFYDITYTLNGENEKLTTKIFFKGDLLLNRFYYVKIKDENFNFLDKTLKKQFNTSFYLKVLYNQQINLSIHFGQSLHSLTHPTVQDYLQTCYL